jgi:hypothetical protein
MNGTEVSMASICTKPFPTTPVDVSHKSTNESCTIYQDRKKIEMPHSSAAILQTETAYRYGGGHVMWESLMFEGAMSLGHLQDNFWHRVET